MLNQLSDFLVEFYHVWLPVNEVLDGLPIFKHLVAVGLLRAASERINQLAKHLRSCEGLSQWFFDSQHILVEVESDFGERVGHVLLDHLRSYLLPCWLDALSDGGSVGGLHVVVLSAARGYRRPSGIRPASHLLRGVSVRVIDGIGWGSSLSALKLVESLLDLTFLGTQRLNSLSWRWFGSSGVVTVIFRGWRGNHQIISGASLHRDVRLILYDRSLLFRRVVFLDSSSLLLVAIQSHTSTISGLHISPIYLGVWLGLLCFALSSGEHVKGRRLKLLRRLCGFLLGNVLNLTDVLESLFLWDLLDRSLKPRLMVVVVTRFACLNVEHLVALHAYVNLGRVNLFDWKLRLFRNFYDRYDVIGVFKKWLLVVVDICGIFGPVHALERLLLVSICSPRPLRADSAFI